MKGPEKLPTYPKEVGKAVETDLPTKFPTKESDKAVEQVPTVPTQQVWPVGCDGGWQSGGGRAAAAGWGSGGRAAGSGLGRAAVGRPQPAFTPRPRRSTCLPGGHEHPPLAATLANFKPSPPSSSPHPTAQQDLLKYAPGPNTAATPPQPTPHGYPQFPPTPNFIPTPTPQTGRHQGYLSDRAVPQRCQRLPDRWACCWQLEGAWRFDGAQLPGPGLAGGRRSNSSAPLASPPDRSGDRAASHFPNRPPFPVYGHCPGRDGHAPRSPPDSEPAGLPAGRPCHLQPGRHRRCALPCQLA